MLCTLRPMAPLAPGAHPPLPLTALPARTWRCTYPQAAYWKDYCELEVVTGDEASAKALFGRCLLSCLSVDLWRVYLQFVKKARPARAGQGRVGWDDAR